MAPLSIAVASFANMFCVGTIYALSMLQAELPRLFKTSNSWGSAPFGVSSLGLSIGLSTCSWTIAQRGAVLTAARGTALWGYAVVCAGFFLGRLNLELMILSFFTGGVGVGWTYLGVVVMVSQGFPNLALARSAIGPMGFSSGTAACISLSSIFKFGTLDSAELGHVLMIAGATFLAVGVATELLMPEHIRKIQSPTFGKAPFRDSERFFSILLFFNALPGMTVFAALLPLASYYSREAEWASSQFLPYSMLSLASGGILAPIFSAQLGGRTAFVALLCIRGLLLILLAHLATPKQAMLTLLAILFPTA
ncbi:Major facilitator superfamily domain general substrate transporter [Penicillium canescens]|uniref:Major facilitator superfamily domain general substrate transporter n=1 Tax=Penicillium canescens TaxID=5083 RepID=UPI0026E048AD|nr:Major facilitator superfamily domain general substrate transporter [Penicillium canescens]KAJ6039630.1 Major facilitator superfamily domain general substrate transporter [Penicillium canescens]KAJ6068023.1 Major facilitator superfamily domain general substrate transporter [Penicillium canescens]